MHFRQRNCGEKWNPRLHGVMADKGFTIDDLLPLGVSLNIPPFLGYCDQMPPEDAVKTQVIASLWIHVERAINKIKNFHIWSHPFPYFPYWYKCGQFVVFYVMSKIPLQHNNVSHYNTFNVLLMKLEGHCHFYLKRVWGVWGREALIDKQGDFACTNSVSCCIALKFQNINHSQGVLWP